MRKSHVALNLREHIPYSRCTLKCLLNDIRVTTFLPLANNIADREGHRSVEEEKAQSPVREENWLPLRRPDQRK